MAENSIVSTLIRTFSPANKQLWKRAASLEIDGQDPFEILSWKNNDDIIFFPYYDREDVAPFRFPAQFHLAAAEDPISGARKWLCAPPVTVTDEKAANEISLEHLAHGADALFFDIAALKTLSVEPLLQNIQWPYCSLLFYTAEHQSDTLRSYTKERHNAAEKLTGALFWDKRPKKSAVEYFLNETPHIRALGTYVPTGPATQEISGALCQAVMLLEDLDPEGKNMKSMLNATAFSIAAGRNFLETIAKVRALRSLWFQVAQAYGHENYKPDDLHIHVRTELLAETDYQPHGNMIYSTLAAMAAVAGGCDSLTVKPEDERNPVMGRAARNVSSILREESHLGKVADPVAGAYALEVMTHQLARKAWQLFQLHVAR